MCSRPIKADTSTTGRALPEVPVTEMVVFKGNTGRKIKSSHIECLEETFTRI